MKLLSGMEVGSSDTPGAPFSTGQLKPLVRHTGCEGHRPPGGYRPFSSPASAGAAGRPGQDSVNSDRPLTSVELQTCCGRLKGMEASEGKSCGETPSPSSLRTGEPPTISMPALHVSPVLSCAHQLLTSLQTSLCSLCSEGLGELGAWAEVLFLCFLHVRVLLQLRVCVLPSLFS